MTEGMADNTDSQFREQLAREIGLWQREGLIGERQAEQILARYRPRAEQRALRLDTATGVIAVVGAVVLGLGMILFFAANWRGMPAWQKVALVYAATAGAYAGGYLLRIRAPLMPRVGTALLLLGALLFQAGLFLLAQIYNMPVDSPVLLLLGAAGILPLAYATRMRSLLLVGLINALVWLGWAYTDVVEDSDQAFALPAIYLLVGVLLFAGAALHRPYNDRPHPFHAVYQLFGALTVLLAVYILTFESIWEEATTGDAAAFTVPFWLNLLFLLALGATAARLFGWRRGSRTIQRSTASWAMAEAGAMAGLIALAWVSLYTIHPNWSLAWNLAYFLLVILLCVRGSALGEARFVNAGVPLLALGLFTRYLDTFGDLLQGSLFFIIAGLLLLALAVVMERLRRFLLAGGVRTLGGEEARP